MTKSSSPAAAPLGAGRAPRHPRYLGIRLARPLAAAARIRRRLVRLWRGASGEQGPAPRPRWPAGRDNGSQAATAWLIEQAAARADSGGHEAALAWLAGQTAGPQRRARIAIGAACDIYRRHPETAYRLCLGALQLSPGLERAKWLSFALHDAGFVSFPEDILARLGPVPTTPAEQRRIAQIGQLARSEEPPPVARSGAAVRTRFQRSLIWLTKHAAPARLTPQALRVAATVEALSRRGWQVTIATQPRDRPSEAAESQASRRRPHDGSGLVVLPPATVMTGDFSISAASLAESLSKAIDIAAPSVLVTDGDFVMCRAGLFAARQSGIACIMDLGEVQSCWRRPVAAELSGERSAAELRQLALAARLFDSVVVRGGTIAAALIGNGVPSGLVSRIEDPMPWTAIQQTGNRRTIAPLARRPLLGHVGAISPSRGFLELLSRLPASAEGAPLSLLLAGRIHSRRRLIEAAQASGLHDRLIFCDCDDPDALIAQAGRFDLWVEPPPLTMLGTLSPPFTIGLAMGLGKPILAPDLPAYRERLSGYRSSWFYSAEAHSLPQAVSAALGRGGASGRAAGPGRRLSEWGEAYEKLLISAAGI